MLRVRREVRQVANSTSMAAAEARIPASLMRNLVAFNENPVATERLGETR